MSAMNTAMTGLTWDDFLALPEDDAYKHAELIDGELVMNPPSWLHQRIAMRLMGAVDRWTQEGPDRGEVTFNPAVKIDETRGYLPDVAWYPEDRRSPPEEPAGVKGVPAFVTEVLSPTTRTIDALRKRVDYARAGVDEFWLIDPELPVVQVYRRQADADEFAFVLEVGPDRELTSPLLPGFAVTLGALLRR